MTGGSEEFDGRNQGDVERSVRKSIRESARQVVAQIEIVVAQPVNERPRIEVLNRADPWHGPASSLQPGRYSRVGRAENLMAGDAW